MDNQQEPTIPKRCVIYTRKSTEEGLDMDYNSLEAQFDACSAYVRSQIGKGWTLIDKHYDDGGFSGGNMNRPALQVLLKDVAEHNVDIVVVYKIDRISRSLADFTELTRLFEKHGVSLVAVTQQIDTSTSMGRMIINLLMSFAQFERECASDRVRDKIAATRKKGIWPGGLPPYGYKNVDKKLIPDPEKAKATLFAYQRYNLNHSFLQTVRDLNETYGLHHDNVPWNVMHLRALLNQPAVAGKLRDPKTGELYDAVHEAIVPFELWNEVQNYLIAHKTGKREAKCKHIAPLKGVIKCGYCGCAMVPTFCSKDGKATFHYYRCDRTHKHLSETCRLKNISAAAIEAPVFNLIERLITNEYFLQLVASDEKELEMLRQLGKVKARLVSIMTSSERRRLVQLFIRRVDVRTDGIDIVVRGDGFKNLMGKTSEKGKTE